MSGRTRRAQGSQVSQHSDESRRQQAEKALCSQHFGASLHVPVAVFVASLLFWSRLKGKRFLTYAINTRRIGESLEKHSGLSSSVNVFHYATFALFPYAQMPHHHDWHHEGYKSCNFTFSSIGGVWDCAFDTRQAGRAGDNPAKFGRATSVDEKMVEEAKVNKKKVIRSSLGGWQMIAPVLAVLAAAAAKLATAGFEV